MIVHAESGFDRSLARYAGDRDRPASGAIFVADVLGGISEFPRSRPRWFIARAPARDSSIDVALMDCMLNLWL